MAREAYISRFRSAANSFTPDYFFKIVVVAAGYFLAAKFGLSLAGATKQVTTIWPPTAISLTVLFLGGYRLWPGVWLGAFIANIFTHEPVLVALSIATGNTLAGLTGVYLLHRLAQFRGNLTRVNGVLSLIVVAFLSTTISATIGTSTLVISHLATASHYHSVWLVWWLGDTMGILIFAPFL